MELSPHNISVKYGTATFTWSYGSVDLKSPNLWWVAILSWSLGGQILLSSPYPLLRCWDRSNISFSFLMGQYCVQISRSHSSSAVRLVPGLLARTLNSKSWMIYRKLLHSSYPDLYSDCCTKVHEHSLPYMFSSWLKFLPFQLPSLGVSCVDLTGSHPRCHMGNVFISCPLLHNKLPLTLGHLR